MGPKSENVEKPLVFVCFFEPQSGDEHCREEFQLSSPDRLGRGRGRVNPSPTPYQTVPAAWLFVRLTPSGLP